MPEEFEALGQLVCSEHTVWRLYHVRPKIDVLVAELIRNVIHFLDATIRAVHVCAELMPMEQVLTLGRDFVVFLPSESNHCIGSLIFIHLEQPKMLSTWLVSVLRIGQDLVICGLLSGVGSVPVINAVISINFFHGRLNHISLFLLLFGGTID